jgi:hypothetical protein
MPGLNLERVVGNAVHLLGEAIKVRSLPKKPAQGIGITDAPKTGRPAHSIDFSRLSEGGKRGPDASPLSRPVEASPWANWPVVHSLGHLIDAGRHRMFGSASRVTAESEGWVLHREMPAAQAHAAKDAGACGLCISYTRMGQKPIAEMVEPCAQCGSARGHQRDCERVLADRDVYESDWVDLPGQVRFDEWADANERRGYLP